MTVHDDFGQLSWLVEQTVEHLSVKLNPRRVVVRLVHRPTGVMITEHGLVSDTEARLSAYRSLHRALELSGSTEHFGESGAG